MAQAVAGCYVREGGVFITAASTSQLCSYAACSPAAVLCGDWEDGCTWFVIREMSIYWMGLVVVEKG